VPVFQSETDLVHISNAKIQALQNTFQARFPIFQAHFVAHISFIASDNKQL
jgi:hypothetical protein